MDIQQLEEKALNSYFRKAKQQGINPPQPDQTPTIEEVEGVTFITLNNLNGPLVKYKLTEGERLLEVEL